MISYVCDRCERSFEKSASLHRFDVDGVKGELCAFCTTLAKQAMGALIAEGKAKAEASRETGRGIVRALRQQAESSAAELAELKAAIDAAAPVDAPLLEPVLDDAQAQPELEPTAGENDYHRPDESPPEFVELDATQPVELEQQAPEQGGV